MSEERYLIWSHEHQSWWRPGGTRGYTRHFDEAGLFARDRALAICAGALIGSRVVPNELPVRLEDLQEMQRRTSGLSPILREDGR